jgi:hypothetical protein
MTQVATLKDILYLSNVMTKAGVIAPEIENKEGFVRFNTKGCLNDSGYYYITEGIRESKGNYLTASFGCFDRDIDEYFCTLNERPLGVDSSFYEDSYRKHRSKVKEQKELYLTEVNNADHIKKIGIQTDSERQTLEAKQNSVYSTDVGKTDSPVVNSFVMYDGFYAALDSMPDDKTRLEYLDAICYYGLFRKTKEQSPYIKTLLALIKPQMDINFKRRKDGANGGRPKKG